MHLAKEPGCASRVDLVAGVVATDAAADDLGATVVVANLKLDHDLTCAGDGLIVGADGIRMN